MKQTTFMALVAVFNLNKSRISIFNTAVDSYHYMEIYLMVQDKLLSFMAFYFEIGKASKVQ